MCRKTDAAALLVIGPTMVGADERLVVYRPQREARPTMDAEVTPGMDSLTNPPQHNIFVQEAGRDGLALLQIRRVCDHMPVVVEYSVCEHASPPLCLAIR